MLRALVVLPLLLALSSGCSDTDDRPATWAYISATIIQPNCATSRCHSKQSATQGLQLDTREGGYLLVGALSMYPEDDAPQNLIVPGDPDSSKVMWHLWGREVRRMPPENPLPQADIDLIEQWILDGAQDN